MEVRNEYVICFSRDPDTGKKLLVEVTRLLLVEQQFWDTEESLITDEIVATPGWITVVGSKVYRVRQLPAKAVKSESNLPMFETVVNWDDLEKKPEALQ